MSNVNFFARVKNLLGGFLSLFLTDIEVGHPEIAYENSINSMVTKFAQLKNATAALVRRRDEIMERKQASTSALAQVETNLAAAVATNQDDLALLLIQKKTALTTELASIAQELEAAAREAEDAKSALLQVQGKIGELKAEKDSMLAKMKSAEARINIQETLSGFSIDAEVQALDKVRGHIKNKVAEANLGAELRDNDLDVRMAKLGQKAAPLVAQEELNRLKAARQGAQGAATPAASKQM